MYALTIVNISKTDGFESCHRQRRQRIRNFRNKEKSSVNKFM